MPRRNIRQEIDEDEYLKSDKCKELQQIIIKSAEVHSEIADAWQNVHENIYESYYGPYRRDIEKFIAGEVRRIFSKIGRSIPETEKMATKIKERLSKIEEYSDEEIKLAFLAISFSKYITPCTTHDKNLAYLQDKFREAREAVSSLFSSCGAPPEATPPRNRDSEQPVVGPATARLAGSRKPGGNGRVVA